MLNPLRPLPPQQLGALELDADHDFEYVVPIDIDRKAGPGSPGLDDLVLLERAERAAETTVKVQLGDGSRGLDGCHDVE